MLVDSKWTLSFLQWAISLLWNYSRLVCDVTIHVCRAAPWYMLLYRLYVLCSAGMKYNLWAAYIPVNCYPPLLTPNPLPLFFFSFSPSFFSDAAPAHPVECHCDPSTQSPLPSALHPCITTAPPAPYPCSNFALLQPCHTLKQCDSLIVDSLSVNPGKWGRACIRRTVCSHWS